MIVFGFWCAASTSFAQDREVEFPISPTPIGAGARAAGMAGAFVAIADDATAASWNPAGLIQLERPEFSVVGAYDAIREDFVSDSHSEIEKTFRDDRLDLNFASFVYPIPRLIGGRNAVVSLSYQKRFDLSRSHDFPFSTRLTSGDGSFADIEQDFEFDQEGGLSTISPAFAIELTTKLSIGATVNFWRKSFLSDSGWTQSERFNRTSITHDPDPDVPVFISRQRGSSLLEYNDFRGENYTLGLLWNVFPKWSIGVRYDTKFTGKVDFDQKSFRDGALVEVSEGTRDITFPATLAVGVSWRMNDKLMFSVDVTTTDWNDMVVETEFGDTISLIDSTNQADEDVATKFDDTITVRFGTEYVLLPKNLDSELNYLWTLRGGLFYDEEPASGRRDFTVSSKGTGEADAFYGFTLGLGLLAHQRANFDIAYQMRRGDGVNSDLVQGVPGFEEDVVQHRVLLSAVIYF